MDDFYSTKMKECNNIKYEDADMVNPREAHIQADSILIDLLKQLGYTKTCEEWVKVEKWYS